MTPNKAMAEHFDRAVRKLRDSRPSRTLWLASLIGVAVATVGAGFGWGGWVTADGARYLAEQAARNARARLVADVCVQRYISGENFAERFAELKDAVTFKRQDLIEDGHWAVLPGLENPIPGAARLCANELAGMNIPNNPAAKSMDSGLGTG